MLRWLHRILDRRYGAQATFSPLSQEAWDGLLASLDNGYEAHEPVFLAVQHILHAKEREAFEMPRPKSPDDLKLWGMEQYGVVREANMLRRVFRLPIEGAKLKAAHAKREKAKEAAEKRVKESVDLD